MQPGLQQQLRTDSLGTGERPLNLRISGDHDGGATSGSSHSQTAVELHQIDQSSQRFRDRTRHAQCREEPPRQVLRATHRSPQKRSIELPEISGLSKSRDVDMMNQVELELTV